MSGILFFIISAVAIALAAYLIPGVMIQNFLSLILVAIVWGIINVLIRPLILLLTLPINILTLGLFTFVINALLVLLVSAIVPGFKIRDFGSALLFAIVVWLINWFLSALII
ncbi:MAG: phage holin family protein [Patescibacteria group bacterium]|jgi:putative membrane protein